MKPPSLLVRWIRFNAAGALGVLVQLGMLALLAPHLNYLLATAIAVEIAVLHNFLWHERMTFAERTTGHNGVWRRLLRFHLSNGLISIVGSLALTRFLVEGFAFPLLAANLVSIIACSLANFAASEWFVFALPKRVYPEDQERLFI